MEIPQILERYKTVTVVGLSRDETKYSYIVAKYMQDAGYKIIPVNPMADKMLLGEKAFKSVTDIDRDLGIVVIFRPSADAFAITREAIANRAKVIWLQEGITNQDAKEYAELNGVEFIQDKCIMKEYQELHGAGGGI